ncbi:MULTISPECIES: PIN-like domain-containing protein [Cupriavidus]
MKFFADNNLPPPLARALHALSEAHGHMVIPLRDRFPQNTADETWISVLSQEGGWAVVTHDKLNKGLEREALRRAGLIVFFLDKSWSNHQFWSIAHNLVRWWPRIIEQSEGIKGGAAFKVPFNFSGKGQFEQVKL